MLLDVMHNGTLRLNRQKHGFEVTQYFYVNGAGGLGKLRLARWVNSIHRSHVVFLFFFDERLPGQIFIYILYIYLKRRHLCFFLICLLECVFLFLRGKISS